VSRALADLSVEPSTVAFYLLRILERDPYDEDAHLASVKAHLRAGAHGQASRAYLLYTTRMNEIGVEPAPYPATHEALHRP